MLDRGLGLRPSEEIERGSESVCFLLLNVDNKIRKRFNHRHQQIEVKEELKKSAGS